VFGITLAFPLKPIWAEIYDTAPTRLNRDTNIPKTPKIIMMIKFIVVYPPLFYTRFNLLRKNEIRKIGNTETRTSITVVIIRPK